MKLWKCHAVAPIEGLMSVHVVVLAETRQQAIEKARTKLLEALGHVFPDHYRLSIVETYGGARHRTPGTGWRSCRGGRPCQNP
jgi:hypothetical protein